MSIPNVVAAQAMHNTVGALYMCCCQTALHKHIDFPKISVAQRFRTDGIISAEHIVVLVGR